MKIKWFWLLMLLPICDLPWSSNPQLPKVALLTMWVVGNFFLIILQMNTWFAKRYQARQETNNQTHPKNVASHQKTTNLFCHSCFFIAMILWIGWLFLSWLIAACFSTPPLHSIAQDIVPAPTFDHLLAMQRCFYWVLLVCLCYHLARLSPQDYQTLILGFLLSGSIAAAYGIYQSYNPIYINTYPAYVSTFGNINAAGACMAILLLLLTFPMPDWNTSILRWLRWGLASFILIYLVRTGSRAAWLAVIVGYLVVAILSWRNKRFFISCKIAIGIVCLLLLPLLVPDWRSTFFQRWQELTQFHTGSVAVRQSLWAATLDMTQDYPWGVGPGQFSHHFYRYRQNSEYQISQGRLVEHPHNAWLLQISESGWIAGTLFLCFIILLIWELWKLSLHPDAVIATSATTWSGILAALLVMSLVSDPWVIPEIGFWLIAICGWIGMQKKILFISDPNTTMAHILQVVLYLQKKWILVVVCILLSILLILLAILPLCGDIYYHAGQTALKQKAYFSAWQNFSQAVSWYPHGLYYVEWGRTALAMRNYERAKVLFQKTLQTAPELEAAHIDLGLAFYGLATPQTTKQIWKNAQDYFPLSPVLQNNIQQLEKKLSTP